MSLINDALKRASEAQKKQPRQPRMPEALMRPVEAPATSPKGWLPLLAWSGVLVILLAAGSWSLWRAWQGMQKPANNTQTDVQQPASKPAPPLGTNKVVKATPSSNPPSIIVAKVTPAPKPVTTVTPAVSPSSNAIPPVVAPTVVKIPGTNVPPPTSAPPPPPVVTPAPPPVTAPPVVIAQTNTPPPPTPIVVAPPVAPPPAPAPAVAMRPRANVTFPPLKLQGIIYKPSDPSAIFNGRTVYTGETIEEVRVVRIERDNVLMELGGQTNTFYLLR